MQILLVAEVKDECEGPGQVAQLVRASSLYTKVEGLIPSESMFKD